MIKEELKKNVVRFGNAAMIVMPKSWLGRNVLVISKQKPLVEDILEKLEPYLTDIEGVFLYGSYARNEQESNSDIDLLVVSNKKLNFNYSKYDINVKSLEDIKNAIKNNPLYSLVIKEAKPILNNALLEELKKLDIKKDFKWIIETTESSLKIIKEFIDLENDDFNNYNCIYSLVLRLRGMYMIKCIKENMIYSNKNFKRFIMDGGINKDLFNELYQIYRAIRDKRLIKSKVHKKGVKEIYLILEKLIEDEKRKKS